MGTPIVDEADALTGGRGLVHLPLSCLSAEGEDAASWLAGQLTQDTAALAVGACAYSLLVTVKGKILSDLWVFREAPETFLLWMPEAMEDTLMAHLDRFLIMEDVDLGKRSGHVLLHGTGPTLPLEDHAGFAAVSRFGIPGFDLRVPEDHPAARGGLPDRVTVGPEGQRLARLRNGIPSFGIDFDENHYPQEAGLKGAVSFTKGCYVGQEVVCMLENRGRLKRRLVVLGTAQSPVELAPGTPLTAAGGTVGTVTSVAQDREQTLAFGFLKVAHSEVGQEVSAGDTVLHVVRHARAPSEG